MDPVYLDFNKAYRVTSEVAWVQTLSDLDRFGSLKRNPSMPNRPVKIEELPSKFGVWG